MTTTTEMPRSALVRAVPFQVTRTTPGSDGLTFEGYAAVWDSPTLIDSWEGYFAETIRRGAFAKTLRERTPVLQFDHGSHPLIGSLPIGVITDVREDDRGVKVTARLHKSPIFEPVREAIESGAIGGMSFRFEVVRDEMDKSQDPPLRTLIELKCAELGPVVFPAYADTEASVRTRGVQQIVEALRVDEIRDQVLAAITPNTSDPAPADATRDQEHDAPSRPAHPSQQARQRYLALSDMTSTKEGAP